MKKDYRSYTFEDFSKDENFRNWVYENQPADSVYWEQFVTENPSQQKNTHLAKSFLLALRGEETVASLTEIESITSDIIEQSRSTKLSFWKLTSFRAAASITLLFGFAFLVYLNQKDKNPTSQSAQLVTDMLTDNYIETINATQSIQNIVLADNSVVTLYPASKIRYSEHFSNKKRAVYLTGQAFFKITPDPNKSFWVYTDYISTQVLGTSFMINASDGTKDISVQVKTGKVSVYTKKDLEKVNNQKVTMTAGVVLTPNQQVFFSKSEQRLIKTLVEKPEEVIELPKESFIFDEIPISKVFSLIEKTYGTTIIYDAKNMEQCYLSANLEESSLYDKVDLICKVTHATYEIVDAQIIIHSKGCR